MKYDEVTKNKRLTNFSGLREYVVSNTVKIDIPKESRKKEENSTLFSFEETE